MEKLGNNSTQDPEAFMEVVSVMVRRQVGEDAIKSAKAIILRNEVKDKPVVNDGSGLSN